MKVPHEHADDSYWVDFCHKLDSLDTKKQEMVKGGMSEPQLDRLYKMTILPKEEKKKVSQKSLGKCPDCEGVMRPIRVLEQGNRGESLLKYAEMSAQQTFWLGSVEKAGTIQAFACRDCYRVLFYAVPYHLPEDEGQNSKRGLLSFAETNEEGMLSISEDSHDDPV